jgi:hypothetical protein
VKREVVREMKILYFGGGAVCPFDRSVMKMILPVEQ